MKTLLEKIIIIVAIICYSACLPDSSTKWEKNNTKATSGASGSGTGSSATPTPGPLTNPDGSTATITNFDYSQDIILLKLDVSTSSTASSSGGSSSSSYAFADLFQADGVFNPGTVDGVSLNRSIPKNANAISTTLFNGNGIYVTSKPATDGSYARGIVTGINTSAQYVYLKVLRGSFKKEDEVDTNYYYYSQKTKVSEVTHVFSVGSTITSLSPVLTPTGFSGLSFTVNPKLPTGLTLNYSTGIISGTPTTETKGTYTFAVREYNGSTFTRSLRISTTSEPSGLGMSNNVILVVSSTANFAVGSYVSASLIPPTTATGPETTRSPELYPWGIVKEIISTTQMLIQMKNGKFYKNDLLDNAQRFENTEALLTKDPLPVSVVLTISAPVAAYSGRFNYNVETSTTQPVIYAKNWAGAIGHASVFQKNIEGKGIVMYFKNNPTTGVHSKMYVLTTYGNFAKGLPIFDSWSANSTSTALGTITFVQADNVILGVKASGTNGCRHGGGVYTTKKTCIANSPNTGCFDSAGLPLGYADSKTCRTKGGIWIADYYAWRGIENFSAGLDVSNNPSGPVVNCDGTNNCKGTGFVTYTDTSAREIHVKVNSGAFGSDYSGTGESIDNLNVYNKSTGPTPNAKAFVGMVMSSNHFDLYTDEYFSTTTKLYVGQNVTFSVSPTLPEGLTLDGETGIIYGSPKKNSDRTVYTLTAHSGNSDATETLTFSMKVHGHMKIFSGTTNSGSYYPRSYVMHRLGRGNHHQECRLTTDQIRYGALPEDPEIITTRRIACFLEVQEEELFVNGLTLGTYLSPGLCDYLHYKPYSYYEWKYIRSYPGTTERTLPAGGVVTELAFSRVTNGCSTPVTTALLNTAGVPIQVGAQVTAVYKNNNLGQWVLSSEAEIHGNGDYRPSGPNCDDGSYTDTTYTYNEEVDEFDNTTCVLTTTSENISVGGSRAACITGPLRHTSPLASDTLYGTVVSYLENKENSSITKSWEYKPIMDLNTLGGIRLSTNKFYANYVAKNSCAGGMKPTGSMYNYYNTNNQFLYFFDGWVKYANNYHSLDYTTMIDPFKGSQPFYQFTCSNASFDPKAEIYLMVREWDRNFVPVNNITDDTNILYNQEIDQLFPGANLPIPSGDANNFNHPDHLLLNSQVDPVDYQIYDDFASWDTDVTWSGTSAVTEYNSCFQDFAVPTKTVDGAVPPTNSGQYFAFPGNSN